MATINYTENIDFTDEDEDEDEKEELEEEEGVQKKKRKKQPKESIEEAPANLSPEKYLNWRLYRWKSDIALFIRAVLGEFFATAMFVFMILAAVIHFDRAQALNHTAYIANPAVGGISTAFAGVVVIFSFADISGAHFNPAVTFATVVTFKMSIFKGLCYIISQCAGATFASLLLALIFPGHIHDVGKVVVKPLNDVFVYQAFFAEMILTGILVYVIFAVAFDTIEPKLKTDNKVVGRKLTIYSLSGSGKSGFAPIAIGFTLGALVLASGTISGGAFNPARAWGPALVSWHWDRHWLYWIADFIGAGLAGWLQKVFAKPSKKITDFEDVLLFNWLWEGKKQFPHDEWRKFLISWLV